jgi:uncharacterized protein YdeI (BOF family)
MNVAARLTCLLSVLTIVTVLAAVPAGAAPAQVTLTVTTPVLGGPGAFVADAPLCADGTTSDVAFVTGAGSVTVYHSDKTFVCSDGSGTFTVSLVARRFDGVPGTTGTWHMAAGTGAYSSLQGSGSLVGTDQPGGGIVDVFTGHISP